jgi:hypothetical protein
MNNFNFNIYFPQGSTENIDLAQATLIITTEM